MAEFLQKINWIDLLVVILLVRSSYVGFTKGLGWELFRFIAVICAVLGSIYYYEIISQLISDYFPALYPFSNLVGFTSLYFLILLLSRFINILIEKIIKIEILSALERLGGFLVGLLRGAIILSLLLISLIFTPIPYFEKSIKERSYTGQTILRIAPFLYEKASVIFPALRFGQRNIEILKLTGFRIGQGALKGDKVEKRLEKH